MEAALPVGMAEQQVPDRATGTERIANGDDSWNGRALDQSPRERGQDIRVEAEQQVLLAAGNRLGRLDLSGHQVEFGRRELGDEREICLAGRLLIDGKELRCVTGDRREVRIVEYR